MKTTLTSSLTENIVEMKYSTRIASAHVETATCCNCGSRFKRGTREAWKTLCVRCWKWQQSRKHIAASIRFLSGV